MTQWTYARLIVSHVHEREVTRGRLRSKTTTEQYRTAYLLGAEGQLDTAEMQDHGLGPTAILNWFGASGWEVAGAFRDGDQYEFVMKQPIAPAY
jgi:hypothetical protein